MPHIRQRIRDAVKAALLGNTPAGENVFTNRTTPFWPNQELPAISISTPSETYERLVSTKPRTEKRTITLIIHIVDMIKENVVNVIDDIAVDVETIVNNTPFLGIEELQYNDDRPTPSYDGTTTNESGNARNEYAVNTMTFTVIYNKNIPDENNNLENFDEANIRYDSTQDGNIEAVDIVDLSQA